MISFSSRGSFRKTELFLRAMQRLDIMRILHANGELGVQALSSATPYNSGRASRSWSYTVNRKGTVYTIAWTNSDIENGFPVVIMLQYGYSTGTGGYVKGEDFINPAIKPIFDKISDEVWKVVTSA